MSGCSMWDGGPKRPWGLGQDWGENEPQRHPVWYVPEVTD